MGCCGEKRKNLFKTEKQGLEKTGNDKVLPDNSNSGKVFIYTGNASLNIKGVSGKTYHFRFNGEKLKVSAIDQLAFMAERDLKVYKSL